MKVGLIIKIDTDEVSLTFIRESAFKSFCEIKSDTDMSNIDTLEYCYHYMDLDDDVVLHKVYQSQTIEKDEWKVNGEVLEVIGQIACMRE